MKAEPIDRSIASLAVLLTNQLRERSGKVAAKLGPGAVKPLVQRLKKPRVSAEAAGLDPMFHFEWPWKWTATIIELLGGLGLEGSEALWSLTENSNDSVALRALVVLLRMPASAKGETRSKLLAELKTRLPKFYRKDVPLYPIVNSMLIEARREPPLLDVLSELSELVLFGEKKAKFKLGDMARDILHPPAPPPPPPERPESKQLATKFADALVARDLHALHDMLASPLKEKKTPKKLEAEFKKESSHCGWPVRHDEPEFSRMRADELRAGNSKHEPSLPKHVTDDAFRNWLVIRFWPDEDQDVFAFDLGVAVVNSAGELKVGYYWATAED